MSLGFWPISAKPIAVPGVIPSAPSYLISWTVGEAGCTYTVYYSKVGEAINYGSFATPAPITTAVDATSQTLSSANTGYPGKVRVAVLATKGGVEEHNGIEFEFELDAAGNIVLDRPNPAVVEDYSLNGLDLTVRANQLTADEIEAATTVDLFIKPIGTALDFNNAQASQTLNSAPGHRYASLTYTVPAAGWYHFTVIPKTASGTYAETYSELTEYITNTAPTGGAVNILITAGI